MTPGCLNSWGFFIGYCVAGGAVSAPRYGLVAAPACALDILNKSSNLFMRAIERLAAAVNMQPQRKAVELPDGSEFVFYMKPLTLAQRARAQKQAKNDDATDFALQLMLNVCRDENGQAMFVAGDLSELRNALPAKLVDELMLVMLDAKNEEEDEDEDEEEVTPKSSPRTSRKTTS